MHRLPRAIENSASATSIRTTTPNQRNTMTEPHDDKIVHRKLKTDREEPAVAIAEVVAELEGTNVEEMTTTYDCINGMISELYSNPPLPEAQMTVEFTYSGYRITVEQNGAAVVHPSQVTPVGRVPDNGRVSRSIGRGYRSTRIFIDWTYHTISCLKNRFSTEPRNPSREKRFEKISAPTLSSLKATNGFSPLAPPAGGYAFCAYRLLCFYIL